MTLFVLGFVILVLLEIKDTGQCTKKLTNTLLL